MIGKVTRGRDVAGLLRYLFGPGRADEHLRPHLVASWRGDDPVTLAGLHPAGSGVRPDVADLAARLSLPLHLQPDVDRPVWQCSMRTAPGDRVLTDGEWAQIARDVLHRVGIAAHRDDGACRWIAIRHAADHIHIAAVLARVDGHPVTVFRDWPKVHAAARAAERRFGLQFVAAPSRTHQRSVARGEIEKVQRTARAGVSFVRPESARQWLARQVRAAAAGSSSRQEFDALLAGRGVVVTWRQSQQSPGEITGYAVGRPGDVDAAGRQVWFGGSKLAADLSLPRLSTGWRKASRRFLAPAAGRRGPRPGDLATIAAVAAHEASPGARIAADLARIARSL